MRSICKRLIEQFRMESEAAIRREIGAAFRINAFSTKKEALDFCTEILKASDKLTRARWMEKIIAALRNLSLPTPVLSEDVIRDVVTQISVANQKEIPLFNVFDAFHCKRYEFDPECKKMSAIQESGQVACNVSSATAAFRHRYKLIYQRARRLKTLSHIKLRTVDSLLGCTTKIENVVLLGMLTQQTAECYHLEDLTGSLRLDFSEASFKPGLYTEGGIYLFEGTFDAGILMVNLTALVPSESAEDSRSYYGNENFFGGEDTIAFCRNKKLVMAEKQKPHAAVVLLSEVHLDVPEVLRALYHLWTGFSSVPPIAFVLSGNFCSRPGQAESMTLLENGFRRLANQLNEEGFRAAFKDTSFVFVPGPDDPSLNLFLPRQHLPQKLFKYLENLPKIYFVSNPVRLQYGTKEIVVIRNDLVEKICKHAVNKVDQETIPEQFSRTILSQAHLSPLPLQINPVLWEFDGALSLHPLPDLVVVCDKFKQFTEEDQKVKVTVCNPGSFSSSSGAFGFLVYYPHLGTIETSGIDF